MKYIFILQLLVLASILITFSQTIYRKIITKDKNVTKSEIFIYIALLFMTVLVTYVVAYSLKSTGTLHLFMTLLSAIGLVVSGYGYYSVINYRKKSADIEAERAYKINLLLVFIFEICSLLFACSINVIGIFILPLLAGIFIFHHENIKLKGNGASDYYNEGNQYHAAGEYEKAFKNFMKAAELEYAPGMDNVGLYYEEGIAGTKNIEEAIKYYTKAANLNYPPALYNLGYCYEYGRGVEIDYEKAFNNYKKASEFGNSLATYNLGICYELGKGTDVNYEEAYKCYDIGVKKGDAKSYYKLANLYENGLYVSENLDEALRLYELSSNLGCSLEDEKISYIKELKLKKYLGNIIGLDSVKREIIGLQAFARLQKKRMEQNIDSNDSLTMHMIFSGNPGTGKTTIARAVAEMFNHIGVLKTSNVVEADRETLVGQYIGQTAIKTKEVFERALDGVLFIDEVYSLSRGGENDFGREAIDTLVRLMEDYRDRVVIVLAGYTEEMDKFLKTNSGLKSRFPNVIEFPDYSNDELLQILDLQVEKNDYILSVDAKLKIKQLLEEKRIEPNFGNGRGIRNLFEKAVKNMAVRLSNMDQTELTKENFKTILPNDIEWVE